MKDPYTVLLVEDNEDDAFLVRRALPKCGIFSPVQWVKDGLEAVAYLTAQEPWTDRTYPEIIVLDLKMPGMSGLDLLGWLRDHAEFQVIPTIVMSSSKHDSDVRQAYRLGANTYFVKPSNLDTLAKLVDSVHHYWQLSLRPVGQTRPNSAKD